MIPLDTGFLVKAGIVIAALAAAYIQGCSDEKERFDRYKIQVEALQRAHEMQAKAWAAAGKVNKEKADATYDRVVGGLLTAVDDLNKRLRQRTANSGVVPEARPVTEGGDGDTICFSQKVLDSGIRSSVERLLGRFSAIVHEGEKARAAFEVCKTWAIDNANR